LPISCSRSNTKSALINRFFIKPRRREGHKEEKEDKGGTQHEFGITNIGRSRIPVSPYKGLKLIILKPVNIRGLKYC
jgi:hypothetical protein